MDDLISRQAVLSLAKELKFGDYVTRQIDPYDVQMLPSAQPEKRTEERTETHACDLISRQEAIDAIEKYDFDFPDYMERFVTELRDAMKEDLKDDIVNLPSAQLDLNEWCTDCKEYDKEKHSCPRFNRVIREALKDAKPERKTGKWISTDDGWDGEYFVCSVCGCPWTLIEGSPEDNGMNFCPNCGAYMRGEQNG